MSTRHLVGPLVMQKSSKCDSSQRRDEPHQEPSTKRSQNGDATATECLAAARKLLECEDQDSLSLQLAPLLLEASEATRLALVIGDSAGSLHLRVTATKWHSKLVCEPLNGHPEWPFEVMYRMREECQRQPPGETRANIASTEFAREETRYRLSCVPLFYRTSLLGCVYLEHRAGSNPINLDGRNVLGFLSELAGSLLGQFRASSQQTSQAQTLTKNEHEVTARAVSLGNGDQVVVSNAKGFSSTELALRESEQQLNRIAENVPGMVYRYVVHPDRSLQFLYVGSESSEMFGATPEELLRDGSRIGDWIHAEDLERLIEYRSAGTESLRPQRVEYRVETPHNGLRWYHSHCQPERLTNGDVIWDGVVLDVTEHKETQLALQEAKSQYQRMTENVSGMIYQLVMSADGIQKLTYVGPEVRELYGIEPDEAIENVERVFERIHPDDIERVQHASKLSKEQLTTFFVEFRIVIPGRPEMRWAQCVSQPHRADNGDIIWDGVAFDVTDRIQADRALEETQAKFQRMAENVPGMIYRYVRLADGSDSAVYVSSQCRELFEVDPCGALEQIDQITERIVAEDREAVRQAFQESSETLEQVKVEYRVNLPLKGQRWQQSIGQPVRGENGETIWDGVVIDITHRKSAELQLQRANEELARATRMKDQFLANMSHELRTPLSAILGMTEGLQLGVYGPPTQQQLASFEVIQQSGTHLLELINEVLDLATIESGAMHLHFTTTDVATLCQSAIQLIERAAAEKKLTLQSVIPADLPLIVIDETRVRQILLNLLSNAIKFTPNGGSILLDVEQLPKDDEVGIASVRFSVSDTGIGIEEAKFESIFHPFVQLDSSLARNYEGTGLGLSLVKRFAELHGGHVELASEPGAGTCVRVVLPVKQPDPPQETPPVHVRKCDPPESIGSAALVSPRILLAEDNELVGEATHRFLEASNFQVTLVADGINALQTAREQTPDLILMDIQMPGMDGLEVIRQLRTMPDLARTPIVALTGLAMDGDSSRCLEAGADLYVSKPYRMRELVGVINQLLAEQNGTSYSI